MGQKMDAIETIELYARYSALLARRMATTLVEGFRSAFTVDGSVRDTLFRERGITLAKGGHYSRAATLLEPLLAAHPTDPEIMLHLGMSYLRTGRQEDGIRLLEKMQAMRGDIKSATALGIAYCQVGRDEQAIPLLQRAAEANSDNFNIRYRLGVAFDNVGRHEKAIECLQEALELRPEDARAYRAIAFAYEQKGDHETAVGYFKRASELEEGKV
ncbi:MAG: magnetosome protein MamA [Alphaproteobacteria bacterium]